MIIMSISNNKILRQLLWFLIVDFICVAGSVWYRYLHTKWSQNACHDEIHCMIGQSASRIFQRSPLYSQVKQKPLSVLIWSSPWHNQKQRSQSALHIPDPVMKAMLQENCANILETCIHPETASGSVIPDQVSYSLMTRCIATHVQYYHEEFADKQCARLTCQFPHKPSNYQRLMAKPQTCGVYFWFPGEVMPIGWLACCSTSRKVGERASLYGL